MYWKVKKMNKRGGFWFIIFMIILAGGISLLLIGTYQNEQLHKNFCRDNGFETYEKATTRWDTSLCIKIEDNYRIEKEYDRCGSKLCFVKKDVNVGNSVAGGGK